MPRRFLSLLEVILGYVVTFRTHLVGLFTFYLGESYHYFFWFGPSIGILHRAYIGQKRSKKGHLWSNLFLIEIDAPIIFITIGGNFRVV